MNGSIDCTIQNIQRTILTQEIYRIFGKSISTLETKHVSFNLFDTIAKDEVGCEELVQSFHVFFFLLQILIKAS